jgi:hypothetical protein
MLLLFINTVASSSGVGFIEPILEGIKEILQLYLPAKLITVAADFDDQVTLIDPKTYSLVNNFLRKDFPSIEIYPIAAPGEDYTSRAVDLDYLIKVQVWVGGQDELEYLAKYCYRYLRAVAEVLKATDTLYTKVNLCQFNGFDYYGIDINDNGLYMAGGAVILNIKHVEILQ